MPGTERADSAGAGLAGLPSRSWRAISSHWSGVGFSMTRESAAVSAIFGSRWMLVYNATHHLAGYLVGQVYCLVVGLRIWRLTVLRTVLGYVLHQLSPGVHSPMQLLGDGIEVPILIATDVYAFRVLGSLFLSRHQDLGSSVYQLGIVILICHADTCWHLLAAEPDVG